MKFDNAFSEPVLFEPDGWHISRKIYVREEAAELIAEAVMSHEDYMERVIIKPEDLSECWVRFEPSPPEMRGELGDFAWMVQNEKTPRSQPTWMYQ